MHCKSHAMLLIIIAASLTIAGCFLSVGSFFVSNTKFVTKLAMSTTEQDIGNIISDINAPQANIVEALCKYCVSKSLQLYNSGSDYYSNPKPQMGTWIDREALKTMVDTLEDTELNQKSEFAMFCCKSPVPIIASMYSSDNVDINLIVLPHDSQSVPFTYAPGTLLFYRSLHNVNKVITDINGRIIQNDTLYDRATVIEENLPSDNLRVLQRLGGPTRIIQNPNPTESTVTLEVIIHPPSPGHANFDGGIGVKLDQIDDSTRTIHLSIPENEKANLFVSQSNQLLRDPASPAANESESRQYKYNNIHRILSRNIGGLGEELDDVVRRLLLTRQISANTMRSLGLSHVKGVLFYGPPGTGKTLIAREMARALNARKPKIINGPEVMDKYVGEAERNIRDVFKDAEKEWAKYGEDVYL